jgi:hypothetical protein
MDIPPDTTVIVSTNIMLFTMGVYNQHGYNAYNMEAASVKHGDDLVFFKFWNLNHGMVKSIEKCLPFIIKFESYWRRGSMVLVERSNA